MPGIKAADVYDVIEIIGRDWPKFARVKLGLREIEIEDCESNSRNMLEQRFQMVQTWIRKEGRAATTDRLYALTGRSPSQTQSSAQSQSTSSSQQYYENPAMSNLRSKPSKDLRTPVADVSDPLENLDICKSSQRKNLENSMTRGSPRNSCLKSSETNERATTTTDVPIKAFSENSPAKEHKRSDSGSTSLSNHSVTSEHFGSSLDSVDRKNGKSRFLKKAKSLVQKFRPKDKRQNVNDHKAFTNEETPDGAHSKMCDTVHWEKVRAVTDDDVKQTMKIKNRYKTEKSRGCALILNNGFLHDKNRQRHGSEKDVENMKALWSQIGCDIYGGKAHEEKNAADMKKILKKATKLKNYSYIVVVIMTHGGIVNGDVVFYGIDDEYVSVPEIQTMFNNVEAPQLVDIPKFFIFQFCCGSKPDKGIDIDYREFQRSLQRMASVDTPTRRDFVQIDGKRPTTSDMLFAYPTHINNAALRSSVNGSWFITAITNVFMYWSRQEHVQDMLLRVHKAMKVKFAWYEDKVDGRTVTYEVNAMPYTENSFANKLFFLPGYHKR